jgi:SAM-dependent methyltransferase
MQAVDWHRRFSEQAAWTAQVREYLFGLVKLPIDATVLEVGCGTGAVLSSLSARFTNPIYGVDLDFNYLRLARANLPAARLICGDAHRLPYASGVFDACMCHFFLMWVNAPTALSEMRRVTRPGGWILALAEPDYGGRIDFPAELGRIGRLQAQALRRQGAEPEFGRRLIGLFLETGLDEVRCGVIGGEWTGDRSPDTLESEWQVIHADLHDLASKKDLRDWYLLDRAASANGSRMLYVPVFYAAGRVPPD